MTDVSTFQRAAEPDRKRLLDEFASGWQQRVEFWKHLTGLEATVLGLTVGLLSAGSGHPSGFLIASWVGLLLGVTVGAVLIGTGLEEREWASLRGYRQSLELAEVNRRLAAGEVKDPIEHLWLMGAVLHRGSPGPLKPQLEAGLAASRGISVEEVKAKLREYSPKVASNIMQLRKPTPAATWLQDHVMALQDTFYGLAGATFVLLLLSILTRA